ETTIEIAKGKTLLVKLVSIGPVDATGNRTVFFKLNGQTRNREIHDASSTIVRKENRKADATDSRQVGSPLQGMLSTVFVSEGDAVKINQPLFVIEAMKMETTVTSAVEGTVRQVVLESGTLVNTDDLVLEVE